MNNEIVISFSSLDHINGTTVGSNLKHIGLAKLRNEEFSLYKPSKRFRTQKKRCLTEKEINQILEKGQLTLLVRKAPKTKAIDWYEKFCFSISR
ncbi:MAG: hypothetical protein WCO65_02255 [bacterium]